MTQADILELLEQNPYVKFTARELKDRSKMGLQAVYRCLRKIEKLDYIGIARNKPKAWYYKEEETERLVDG